MSPARRRQFVCHARTTMGVSERRACKAVGQDRSVQRYQPRRRADECDLVDKITDLAVKNPRYGYRRVHALLVRQGYEINRKRVQRIWRQEGLKVPQKQRKRRRMGTRDGACDRQRAEHPNHVWSYDFAADQTACGRSVRVLAVVDEYTRECLALVARRHFPSSQVIEVLRSLVAKRGAPIHMRSDNGPEFVAHAIKRWLDKLDIATLYIEPGSPWQNAYSETFVSRLRDELLNRELFLDMEEVRYHLEKHRKEYNHERPHSSLDYLTPIEYAAKVNTSVGEAIAS